LKKEEEGKGEGGSEREEEELLQESEFSALEFFSASRGGKISMEGRVEEENIGSMLQANPSPLPSAAQQLETWQVCCPHPTAPVPSAPSLASSSSRPVGACFNPRLL
jgi:hypothetical protein